MVLLEGLRHPAQLAPLKPVTNGEIAETKHKFRKAKLTMGYAGDSTRLGVHLTR